MPIPKALTLAGPAAPVFAGRGTPCKVQAVFFSLPPSFPERQVSVVLVAKHGSVLCSVVSQPCSWMEEEWTCTTVVQQTLWEQGRRRQIPDSYGKQAFSHGCLEVHWHGCKKKRTQESYIPPSLSSMGGDRRVCARNLIFLTCLVDSLKILDGQSVAETWENFLRHWGRTMILQSKDRTTGYKPSWFSGTAWQQLEYSLKIVWREVETEMTIFQWEQSIGSQ